MSDVLSFKFRQGSVEDDLLYEHLPSESELSAYFPQDHWEKLEDEQISRYAILEAGANLVDENYGARNSVENVRSSLDKSSIWNYRDGSRKFESLNDMDLAEWFLIRESTEDLDGIGLVNLSGEFGAENSLTEKFREEYGHDIAPPEAIIDGYARSETENHFSNPISGEWDSTEDFYNRGEFPEGSREFVEDYIEFVRDSYEQIWGAAPRGRGISGMSQLARNREELASRENSLKSAIWSVLDRVSPDAAEEVMFDDLARDTESGKTKIMMRPSQQWSTKPSRFTGYGAYGRDEPGIVLRDNDVGNITSSALAGVGDWGYMTDISPAIREFDSENVVLSDDFDPIEHSFWIKESLDN